MLLMRAAEYIGPQMVLLCQLYAILQGPKNSWFPGPNPLPLVLRQNVASQNVYVT
jgi:hypothetical protein